MNKICESFNSAEVSERPPTLLPEVDIHDDDDEDDEDDDGEEAAEIENARRHIYGARAETPVYYHIDDEQIPYSTCVPVPPSRFTLAHLKRALNLSRRIIKCYAPRIDEDLNW